MMNQRIRGWGVALIAALCAALLCCAAIAETESAEQAVEPLSKQAEEAVISQPEVSVEPVMLDKIEITCQPLFSEEGDLEAVELNFTGTDDQNIGFGVFYEIKSENEKNSEKISLPGMPANGVLTNGSYQYELDVAGLDVDAVYIVSASYPNAMKHPEKKDITFKLSDFINIDVEAPKIVINENIDDIDRKISGECPGEAGIEVRLFAQAEGSSYEEAVEINCVKTDKKGRFTFRAKDGNWMEYFDDIVFIQAMDASGNIDEAPVTPMIDAFIKKEIEDLVPITATIKFVDGTYNMTVTAQPKAEIKIEFVDAESGSVVYADTIKMPKEGRLSDDLPMVSADKADKKEEALVEGKSYNVSIAYADEDIAFAHAFEQVFTAYGKLPVIESGITEGINVSDTKISGKVSEAGTVTLWVKKAETENISVSGDEFFELKSVKTAAAVNGNGENENQFVFEGLTPEVGRQYKLSFVSDWGDDGALPVIGVVVDTPVFYSHIEFMSDTIAEGFAAYNKPLEIKGAVLSEEKIEGIVINFAGYEIDLTGGNGLELIDDPAQIAALIAEHPEYDGKGDFKYAAVFSETISVEDYAIGEYNAKVFMADTAEGNGNAVLVPDVVNNEMGRNVRIDKDPKDMGKYAFVLALFALGFVACLAIMIVAGRKVKFLKRAALDSSNESNLTARYKSSL